MMDPPSKKRKNPHFLTHPCLEPFLEKYRNLDNKVEEGLAICTVRLRELVAHADEWHPAVVKKELDEIKELNCRMLEDKLELTKHEDIMRLEAYKGMVKLYRDWGLIPEDDAFWKEFDTLRSLPSDPVVNEGIDLSADIDNSSADSREENDCWIPPSWLVAPTSPPSSLNKRELLKSIQRSKRLLFRDDSEDGGSHNSGADDGHNSEANRDSGCENSHEGVEENPDAGGNNEESDLDVYEEDEAEDKVYCYCHRGSYGFMVACDGLKCRYGGWFHLPCTGLAKVPEVLESWLCKSCKRKKGPRFDYSTKVIKTEPEDDGEYGVGPPATVTEAPTEVLSGNLSQAPTNASFEQCGVTGTDECNEMDEHGIQFIGIFENRPFIDRVIKQEIPDDYDDVQIQDSNSSGLVSREEAEVIEPREASRQAGRDHDGAPAESATYGLRSRRGKRSRQIE
uniref:PHD domain-containing protein n=1 Tax=Haemonchus contortus TaxID=6289 RepID=A0A7I4Z4M9_HAECO